LEGCEGSPAPSQCSNLQGGQVWHVMLVQGKKLGKAAAAVEAQRAARAEADLREQHWRVRVMRAKRRLYLYLSEWSSTLSWGHGNYVFCAAWMLLLNSPALMCVCVSPCVRACGGVGCRIVLFLCL